MMLLFGVIGLLATTTALRVPDTHTVHEARESHSSRWIKKDRVEPHKHFPVRIGLVQSNLDKAHDWLFELSDPASVRYGKHWTSQQVVEAFQPGQEAVSTVNQWLIEHGIENVTHSDNKLWLAFNVPAGKVESLLHTEYFEYEDVQSGNVLPACEQYHLPKAVQPFVDYITPGIKLLAPTITNSGDASTVEKRGWPHQGGDGDPWHHGSGGPPWQYGRPPWKHHQPQWPGPGGYPPQHRNNLSTCDIAITPACIAALYEIPPGHLADPSNSMGIFEAELQFWDQEDLNLFFANFTPWIANGTHPIDHNIDGGVAKTTNISAAGGEAMLDLELAYPIVYPQTITVWNVDDLHYQTWANDTYTWGFNTLLDAIDGSYCTYSAYGETGDAPGIDPTYPDPTMPGGYKGQLQCGVYKPTNVISISYGGQEADVPIAYQKRQCNEYLKLGLQGVSFLFASGDAGVGNYPAPYGTDNPKTGCKGPDGLIFNPTWPNTCPWVTNVGATKVYPGKTVLEPESAVFDPAGSPYHVNYSSGGGFSNVYPIPDYQKSAVATYFADHNPPYKYYSALAANAPNPALPNLTALAAGSGGIYNRIGRGVPDVAANGDNIAMYENGVFDLSGGTSASTPIFAAIINRINEERIARGKSSLGFLNPALYKHPEILNDITNGTNPGCWTNGFSAVKGWDPVTGLGTPNYPRMLEFFLSLP